MIAIGSCSRLRLLISISNTTKEVELVRKMELGSGVLNGQDGRPEAMAIQNDRLLDHHIEEILDRFREATREGEADPDSAEQPGG